MLFQINWYHISNLFFQISNLVTPLYLEAPLEKPVLVLQAEELQF